MLFRAREFSVLFPRPTLVMGIVNVTPDSFSDGGRFLDSAAAVEHGLKLAADGADILDIGGESTRPRAEPVNEVEELRRVMPVVQKLAEQTKVPLSIDTMKPAVARAALEAGASIINDVGANRESTDMWELAAAAGAGYVCMHMRGNPQTMQCTPAYTDVLKDVTEFFLTRIDRMRRCGVRPEQIIVDPGIGFGKTLEHNLRLLGGIRAMVALGRPVLVGVSRKSFIGALLGADVTARLPGGLACACMAVRQGARLIRAHDVAETVQAVRMTEAIASQEQIECRQTDQQF